MSAIPVWLVTYLMHSTLLITLAAIVTRFVSSASARDTLWKIALLGGIVTAALQHAIPPERVLPERAPRRMTVMVDETRWIATAPAIGRDPARTSAPPRDRFDWRSAAVAAYVIIALLLLARIIIGRNQFLAMIGARRELVLGPERELLDELASCANITRPIRLTESHTIASPVAMLGREIVLPTGIFTRLTTAQQQTILAHELGHLQRRDPLWLTIAEVVKALLFFQPLNWLVPARLRELAEFLCDDAAVLQTGDQQALAETLAELASHVSAPSAPAVAAMAEGGSNLIVRVTRVLRSHPRMPLRAPARIGITLGVIAVMAMFAPAFGIVRAATRHAKPAARADVSDFTDGRLTQTFNGPDGRTRVTFVGHEVRISSDATFVHFNTPDGFLHVKLQGDHVRREIDATPTADLSPVFRYRVDGRETPWSDEARRALSSAFLAEDAYADQPPPSNKKMSEWNANVHLTGTTDGVPTEVTITIHDLDYETANGAIAVHDGTVIEVAERIGNTVREYELHRGAVHWRGSWDAAEPRETWLRRHLREQTGASKNLVDSILAY